MIEYDSVKYNGSHGAAAANTRRAPYDVGRLILHRHEVNLFRRGTDDVLEKYLGM
jgi:hypothetical protein